MSNIYRAIFQADHPNNADINDWFRKNFAEEADHLVESAAEVSGVKGQRWSLVWHAGRNRLDVSLLQGARSLFIVERSHPDDNDAWLGDELKRFGALLHKAGARLGPFSTQGEVTSQSILAWINAPAGDDAQLAVVVTDSDNRFTRLRNALSDGLIGVAATGTLDLVSAEAISAHSGVRSGQIREGCVLYIGRRGEPLEFEVIPATVASLQPEQAARRIRQRCLRSLAHFRFTNPEEIALTQLSLPSAGSQVDTDQLRGRVFELEDEATKLRDERQLLILEQDELATELDQLQSKNRWLERRLQQLNDYSVPPIDEEVPPPDSCADAIRLARELLPNLVIGDVNDGVMKLDCYEKSIVWAKKMWLGLRALDDYAAAKAEGRHRGDFLAYCSDTPTAGIEFNPRLVALRESETTEAEPKTYNARIFRVPEMVDPSGATYMGAHLKIDAKGSPAPRVHFFDDTAPAKSGRVFVGYAGPHLPTAGY